MDQKSDQRKTLFGLISGFLLDRVTALVFIAPDPFFFIDSAWVKLGELGNMLSFKELCPTTLDGDRLVSNIYIGTK